MYKKLYTICAVLLLSAVIVFIAVAAGKRQVLDTASETQVPDARAEFRRLITLYTKQDTAISISGTITLMDMEENYAEKEATQFVISKNGNNIYSRLGHLSSFLSDSLFAEVDTLDKTIRAGFITNEQRSTILQANASILPAFEKLMADSSAFQLKLSVNETEGQRILRIENEMQPEIKSSKVIYNPADYSISRVQTEWWKKGYNEDNDEKKCWYTEAVFHKSSLINIGEELRKIIKLNGHKIEVTPVYASYEMKKVQE